LLSTDHIKNFTEMITLFVALNVINFSLFDLLSDHGKYKYLDFFYNFYINCIYFDKRFYLLIWKCSLINRCKYS